MKFSFEDLHKNHKYAFADGLLTGILLTVIGMAIYKQIKEEREMYRDVEEVKKDATIINS